MQGCRLVLGCPLVMPPRASRVEVAGVEKGFRELKPVFNYQLARRFTIFLMCIAVY